MKNETWTGGHKGIEVGCIRDASGRMIAGVHLGKEASHRNIDLIAAAPELAAAVVALLPHAMFLINENHPAYKTAAAALTKADVPIPVNSNQGLADEAERLIAIATELERTRETRLPK